MADTDVGVAASNPSLDMKAPNSKADIDFDVGVVDLKP